MQGLAEYSERSLWFSIFGKDMPAFAQRGADFS